MSSQAITREKVKEVTEQWIYTRPLTFSEFVSHYDRKDSVELVRGSVVEVPVVQLDHSRLELWLIRVLAEIIERKRLGILLYSRSAVRIDEYNGRLPDIMFVRQDRMNIV